MEFTLNEEQQMLKGIARDFLENRCPKAQVRDMLTDEKGYSPELWQEMAELGWQGLMFPGISALLRRKNIPKPLRLFERKFHSRKRWVKFVFIPVRMSAGGVKSMSPFPFAP